MCFELLCQPESVKCLCRNVREADFGFCVVVFVENPAVCQHSYTPGLFSVQTSERPKQWEATDWRCGSSEMWQKKFCVGFSNTDMSRKAQGFLKRMNCVQCDVTSVELFTCIENMRDWTDWIEGYLNLLRRVCESELKQYRSITFCSLKVCYTWIGIGKLLWDKWFW